MQMCSVSHSLTVGDNNAPRKIDMLDRKKGWEEDCLQTNTDINNASSKIFKQIFYGGLKCIQLNAF